jgi:hypothetical protein
MHRDEVGVHPPIMAFSHGSRSRLNRRALPLFEGESLFARLARAVCDAECLPRKELYEAWEVARRTRRLMRGGRVVDLAAGHGLLAFAMLLLDDSSPLAVCVDPRKPASADRLQAILVERWPRLAGRVSYLEQPLASFELASTDMVVCAHGCGGLTDEVLDRAAQVRARVAVLPCCHDLGSGDTGGLEGWIEGDVAIDAVRAWLLRARGYRIRTQKIPGSVTPKNRLLLGEPL